MAFTCLQECCRYAEERAVTLFLEAINRYEIDQNHTVEEVMRVIQSIGSGALRLLADTFHMNIEEVDLLGSLRRAAGYLGHVHLSDSNREAPGHGHLDISAILKTLGEIHFDGFLSFEVLPLPSSEQAAQDGFRLVKSLLERQKTC
jgi:sugar phosphate isomerase/epimerase